MEKRARITSVELIRFIAAVVVMLCHFFAIYMHSSDFMPFAFVVVEFFFILSGFFMMKHLAEKETPLSPPAYVFHKVRGFYPVFILAFAVQFILFIITNHAETAAQVGEYLRHFKWEALLLQTAGFIPDPQFDLDYLLGQAWYLSAMTIALVLSYPLAKYLKKWYVTLICPLAILCIYSFILQTYGTLDVGNEYAGVISVAVLRGFAGTCVGSLCFEGWTALKSKDLSRSKPAIVIEIASWLAFVLMLFVPCFQVDPADSLIFVLIFALIVIFAFKNETPVSRFLNAHFTKLFIYLGSFSLYVYMFHWPVMTAMNLWGQGLAPAAAIAIYIAATFALSALVKLYNDSRKSIVPTIIIAVALLALSFTVPLWGLY